MTTLTFELAGDGYWDAPAGRANMVPWLLHQPGREQVRVYGTRAGRQVQVRVQQSSEWGGRRVGFRTNKERRNVREEAIRSVFMLTWCLVVTNFNET